MQLNFNIHYKTVFGEDLVIYYTKTNKGKTSEEQVLKLTHQSGGLWSGTLDKVAKTTKLHYRYVLLENGEIKREEFGRRVLEWSKEKRTNLFIKDAWRPRWQAENTLFSSAFVDGVFNQNTEKYTPRFAANANVSFRIRCPRVTDNQVMAILGSSKELQHWERENALPLQYFGDSIWGIDLKFASNHQVAYKYGILDKNTADLLFLEAGDDRLLSWQQLPKKQQKLLVNDENFRFPQGAWRGTGIAIPVFSIRTKNSLGVGEFTDLKPFADWTKSMGMNLIQVLPVNDTNAQKSWVDSYPYKAISVFALHPQYLNLNSIQGFEKAVDQVTYKRERKRLNALSVVDYEAVMELKLKWARQIFDQEKTGFLQNKDFLNFLESNQHWLKPYAAFCYLRDKYGTAKFEDWKTYSTFSEAGLTKLTNPKARHFDEIAFHYFLQYYLDNQLVEASNYAREHHIVLKGDIPIGIHRYSADAWVAPELYDMNGQAGAPPDDFSDTGQNWGFPTYRWDVMAQDGFQWWKNRFTQLSRYFDAFRIDHILGFFRIWQIPMHAVVGTLGFFNPSIPIEREEFGEREIEFNFDRMCCPYIREYLLTQYFGGASKFVKTTFLTKNKSGVFHFKESFNTQRKVQQWIATNQEYKELESGLFRLLGNVLFIEKEGTNRQQFYPRIELQKTSSFQDLDSDTQDKINALYQDFFYKRQEDFWRESAMNKLPALKSATNMLVCGEDLGMIPSVVAGVMQELEMLTLEIQRMPKAQHVEFLPESHIPYLSVISPSTHDMEPLRVWWKEMDWIKKNRFLNNELKIVGEPPSSLKPWLAEQIIKQHLSWQAMWAIFPFQDLLAIDGKLRRKNPEEERINIPAIAKHYWQYRMHLNVDQLINEKDFNRKIKWMVGNAGRQSN